MISLLNNDSLMSIIMQQLVSDGTKDAKIREGVRSEQENSRPKQTEDKVEVSRNPQDVKALSAFSSQSYSNSVPPEQVNHPEYAQIEEYPSKIEEDHSRSQTGLASESEKSEKMSPGYRAIKSEDEAMETTKFMEAQIRDHVDRAIQAHSNISPMQVLSLF